MEVTEELINSLTREETMRLLYAMSSNTVYLSYYNQMCNGVKVKFEFRPRAGFPNQRRNIPVISIMMWHRTRRHSEDSWKWENSVTPNSWSEFELEFVSILRDRALNCILPE